MFTNNIVATHREVDYQNNVFYLGSNIALQKLLKQVNQDRFQWVIKRLLDITVSALGVVFLSPLWFLIAIIIKIDSSGPIFYKQKRLGLNKKEFYMYKFRSMVVDAEKLIDQIKNKNESNSIMFKSSNDPRVTKVGKFLRKYSLDEFPQLINVLKGEMSLVGPRPPLPSEVKNYQDWHHVRFSTLPGLTGKWQVSGRSKIKDFNYVVYLDYQYIKNWNFLADIKILLKTVPVVLFGKE